jgi:hypothetical protein
MFAVVKKFRQIFPVFIFAFFMPVAARADIASVDYVNARVRAIFGASLPMPAGTIASEKYLMLAADAANGTSWAAAARENVIAKSKVDMILYALSLIHNGAPANSLLSLAQVNQYIPATDVSQWRRIACSRAQKTGISLSNPDSINNATGFITGTIGPGVYFFISNNKTDSGSTQNLSNIILFDHPVGFKIVHNGSWEVFHIFIDTAHAQFQTYNLTNASWTIANYTNVSNIVSGTPAEICIYELV